eukprot:13521_1
MPYRRKPRSQRKHAKGRIHQDRIKQYSKEKRSLIKFGIIPQSVKQNSQSHQPLTKQLASSSKKDRDDGVALVRLILSNSQMDKHQMSQLWKALFYSFWMSDKALIQQELARKLANFIKVCGSWELSLLYIECFMECIEREWRGIDHLRMSKFLSLIRHHLHSAFDFIALNEWNVDLINGFSNILRFKINLFKSLNRGLFLHLSDIYIEELIKISRVDADHHLATSFRPPISFDALYHLLSPFVAIYLNSGQQYQEQYVIRKVFYKLVESQHFDAQQREINLNYPGFDDLDFGIDCVKQCKEKEKSIFDNESQLMIAADPNNPIRRKKRDKTHLLFDKKNFDVVMPFKELEATSDAQKIQKWQIKYKETRLARMNDPLLMKHKMKQFEKVFLYLANHRDTPNNAIKKLKALADMFAQKEDKNRDHHRSAARLALKAVDKRNIMRKWKKIKKYKKKK